MLTWVGENLKEVKGIASGKRVQQWIIWLSLVIGLLSYVAGYALRASFTSEPLAFFGDLLYTLGYALWTGVVVVVFPDHPGGETAAVQGGTRCLRAGAARWSPRRG